MKPLRSVAAYLCCAATILFANVGMAQDINLSSVHAQLAFPDAWLVVTPSGIPVYRVQLEEAGFNTDDMAARFATESIVAEGWNESFTNSYRLMVTEDARSVRIFDIGRASAAQRKAIADSFTDLSQWRITNIRYQEAEWQTHPTMGRFLFLRYNILKDGEIAQRGVQYFTIRNGKNYILDRVQKNRFSNRDLANFKDTLAGFSFTEQLPAPAVALPLELSGGIPRETGDGNIRITGKTEPGAGLVLSHTAYEGDEPITLSVATTDAEGNFTLRCTLADQGVYMLTLTATKQDWLDTAMNQVLTYQDGLIPINYDKDLPTLWTADTYTLSGWTLTGVQLQLLDNRSGQSKKIGKDGRFSFDVDTRLPGEYHLVLVVSMSGSKDRRINIDFVREHTPEHDAVDIREQAEEVSYSQLTKNPADYLGKLLTFTGTVMNVSEGDGVWFARVNVTRVRNGNAPIVLLCDTDPALQEGQKITCFATANAPYVEQDSSGKETTIPSLTTVWIDK